MEKRKRGERTYSVCLAVRSNRGLCAIARVYQLYEFKHCAVRNARQGSRYSQIDWLGTLAIDFPVFYGDIFNCSGRICVGDRSCLCVVTFFQRTGKQKYVDAMDQPDFL